MVLPALNKKSPERIKKTILSISKTSRRWDKSWDECFPLAEKAVALTIKTVIKKTIPCSVSLVLANDTFVQNLNREYRDKDKPTNVLSFPQFDDISELVEKPLNATFALGDIILAFETIKREALEQDKDFIHHTIHLIVHGTLHLLGYDHIKESEAEEMETMETLILKKIGIPDPYKENM